MKRFAQETTIHGFADVHRSGTVGRILWVAVTLSCLSLFGWSIYDLAESYYKQHPSTSVELNDFEYPPFSVAVSNGDGFGFPTFKFLESEGLNLTTGVERDYLKAYFFMDYVNDKWKLGHHYNVTTLLEKWSRPASEVVQQIEYGLSPIRVELWNLYTPYQGIRYVFQPDQGDAAQKQKAMEFHIAPCLKGYHVLAGRDAMSMEKPHYLSPKLECGSIAGIYISTKKYKRQKQYCNPELGLYKPDCYTGCVANEAVGKCGEYLGSLVKGQNITTCISDSDHFKKQRWPGSSEKKMHCVKQCGCDTCGTPCDEFEVTLSYYVRPAEGKFAGSTRFHLYFTHIDHMMVIYTSAKVTAATMLSNVGGMLGLCVGASVLSIVHLLYSLCTCMRMSSKTGAEDSAA